MKKETFAGLFPAWKIGGMALGFLMLIVMASCGGNEDPNSVKLEVKPELGDLGNYMTIDSKEATISLSNFTDDGKEYVKLASTLQVKVTKDVASDWGFDLDVVILDSNMNEISDFGNYDIEDKTEFDLGEFNHYLTAGDYRAVMDEAGPKEDWDGKASAMWEMIKQKGKYIVLKPSYSSSKFVPFTGVASGNSSDTSVSDEVVADEVEVETVSAGSENWDSVLDEYEKYCDKAVALYKKVQAGDMNAMTEYASLVESAESLQKKLENASSDLSAAQAARLNKIAAKMAKAMM